MDTLRRLPLVLWVGSAVLSAYIFLKLSCSSWVSGNVLGTIVFGFLALAMCMVVGVTIVMRVKSRRAT